MTVFLILIIVVYGLIVYLRHHFGHRSVLEVLKDDYFHFRAYAEKEGQKLEEKKERIDIYKNKCDEKARDMSTRQLASECKTIRASVKEVSELSIEDKIKLKSYYEEFESRKKSTLS